MPSRASIFRRCSTTTRPTSWSTASPSTWVCGIPPVRKITIVSVRCPTRKPTSSSFVFRWCRRHPLRTCGPSGTRKFRTTRRTRP